ncbi:hypothetical protein PoB_000301200 [Plakobranchus ocellatus]|uniref:Uncharacterized protein n=1 Tax=Plakobranchus ocellatus TaxID=259542 RepID=A0AAV3Y353_9GAST|nr:hypothetical protein PoB_000301200 [Plakobranchus ocellatus]
MFPFTKATVLLALGLALFVLTAAMTSNFELSARSSSLCPGLGRKPKINNEIMFISYMSVHTIVISDFQALVMPGIGGGLERHCRSQGRIAGLCAT